MYSFWIVYLGWYKSSGSLLASPWRESALAGPMEVPTSGEGATSPGPLGVTVRFLTGFVWQQSQGDYLATPSL